MAFPRAYAALGGCPVDVPPSWMEELEGYHVQRVQGNEFQVTNPRGHDYDALYWPEEGRGECTCPHYRFRSLPQGLACKHLLMLSAMHVRGTLPRDPA